ncbi:unnamed protein product [Camellia sinensis]
MYIVQCAEQFPHKIPLYGTVVGLLNLENEDFVRKVVENTQTTLQDALVAGNCNRIHITMRFLTVMMCSKVLQPISLVVVYETLLSSATTRVDEERGNPSWQACADFYITCILSCLPWGGAELVEQVPEEIERVMVGIEAYLRIRRHTSDIGFAIFEDVNHTEKALDEKGLWMESFIVYRILERPHLSFEAQLVAGKAHDLEAINCPEQPDPPAILSAITCGKQKQEAELKYPQRICRLNVFPANKTEGSATYRSLCCGRVFAGRAFVLEWLLLLLPHPLFKPMYYTLVIIDLCKIGAFPAVVAGAVRALFDKIADLDMECQTRLILWFSHHLSNFQFIWPWEEWAYVLDLPKWAPQRVFVQEVLEREVRLSYWDKVKQSIENAPALEELLPPKGVPNFKYSGEDGGDGTEHALSVELSGMVKERQTIREVISWMEENYGQVITRICTDQDKQVMLIAEVSSYWKNSAQMTAIAIDRMMGYRLISNLAIVTWVFSPANIEQFHTTDHPWEEASSEKIYHMAQGILRNAVNKTYNRISDLRKEISVLKNSVVSAEEAATKAKAELEGAEAKLTLVDGEPVLGENPVRLKRLKANAEKTKEAEVKEALLARALEENEALFLSLFKNFSTVMMERIHDAFRDGTMRQSHQAEEMAIDLEDSSAMELDKENGKPKKSHSNGERANGYNVGEKEQWCLSTLGYVKAFSRQYASEIRPHIEKLDAEVFTENVHPLFRKAVYSGLNRPLNDLGSGQ